MMSTKEIPTTLLLTKKQVACELAISERTVHTLIKQGQLTVVRFGGNVRIDRADLLDFIRRQKGGNEQVAGN
jgi:excisionase family DNA binding protein